MDKKLCYLAGPMAGCDDEQANGWRDYATTKLISTNYRVLSPMVRDYRGVSLSEHPEQTKIIVEGDKGDIDQCDILLANCTFPSVGTSMEIIYAWENDKTVVIVHGGEPSPWLVYHSHLVVNTLDLALENLDLALKVKVWQAINRHLDSSNAVSQ